VLFNLWFTFPRKRFFCERIWFSLLTIIPLWKASVRLREVSKTSISSGHLGRKSTVANLLKVNGITGSLSRWFYGRPLCWLLWPTLRAVLVRLTVPEYSGSFDLPNWCSCSWGLKDLPAISLLSLDSYNHLNKTIIAIIVYKNSPEF